MLNLGLSQMLMLLLLLRLLLLLLLLLRMMMMLLLHLLLHLHLLLLLLLIVSLSSGLRDGSRHRRLRLYRHGSRSRRAVATVSGQAVVHDELEKRWKRRAGRIHVGRRNGRAASGRDDLLLDGHVWVARSKRGKHDAWIVRVKRMLVTSIRTGQLGGDRAQRSLEWGAVGSR